MSEDNKKKVLSEEELMEVSGGKNAAENSYKSCKDLKTEAECKEQDNCEWSNGQCVMLFNIEPIKTGNSSLNWN